MSLEKELFENHLEFFAAHHGTVIRQPGWVLVDSAASDFVIAFAEEKAKLASLPPRFNAVRLLPWSGITRDDLVGAGFRSGTELSYMTLAEVLGPSSKMAGNVSVDIVTSQMAMEIFTKVEAGSFLEEGESFDWWYAWLRQKDHDHDGLSHELRRFYVASIDGEPASVAIGVLLDRVVGIYGVATLPQHRKKGLSTALLRKAVADAKDMNPDVVALQVVRTATYAEDFCKKLGFELAFSTPELVRD